MLSIVVQERDGTHHPKGILNKKNLYDSFFQFHPQYLFSEFTKDLIVAREEFCEACDLDSDSEEKNNVHKLPTKRKMKKHFFTPHYK